MRICAAEPSMQSSRVSITISMMVATPRPSPPTRCAHAPQNSTSLEALAQSPSLSFSRIRRKSLRRPQGSRRGIRKQLRPPGACASTSQPSDIGAEKNHLWPTSRYSPSVANAVARVVLLRTSEPPCFSVMPMPRVMPALSLTGTSRGS